MNNTYAQCVAGQRSTAGDGPVAFIIDNAIALSADNITYTDDPELFSLLENHVIERYVRIILIVLNIRSIILYSNCSGGVNLIFKGKNLNVVQTTMVVDIVAVATGVSVLNYTTVSVCHCVLIEYTVLRMTN